MSTRQADEIEIGFDRNFINKWLKVQKLALAFICVVLAATFSGLLGNGPLAKRTISAGPGRLTITYDRVLHYKAPSEIQVQLPQLSLAGEHEIALYLGGALVANAAVQSILPRPLSAEPLRGAVLVRLPVTGDSSHATLRIIQQPSEAGTEASTIALNGYGAIDFKQFVVP
jgi:hypothetical protein